VGGDGAAGGACRSSYVGAAGGVAAWRNLGNTGVRAFQGGAGGCQARGPALSPPQRRPLTSVGQLTGAPAFQFDSAHDRVSEPRAAPPLLSFFATHTPQALVTLAPPAVGDAVTLNVA
jgi:hypothetical protein